MSRRCEIVSIPAGRGFPYEVGDTPMLADHVADDWVEEGTARELEGEMETAVAPEPAEDATTGTEPVEASKPSPPEYHKEQRSPGWWNVVGPDGEAVNDKALREDDADALIAELEG